MEEQGEWSSARRRPQGSVIFADRSITEDWASLQPDLVKLIADCLLSTGGAYEYMAMRAVCPSWRSAVPKPSPHAAFADLRFRPRQWVLIHGADDDGGRPLFLNVSTGRFLRLRLPVLRDYTFVCASGGLLVLGDRECPHAARLLNPLTGDMLPFAASIHPNSRVETAITSSEPTIIFYFHPLHGESGDFQANCCLQRVRKAVYSADPTGQLCEVKIHDAANNNVNLLYLQSMVTYAGNVYVLCSGGKFCKIISTGRHWFAERILDIDMNCMGSLVEYAGKLLLVKQKIKTCEVFSLDVKRKVLEPIESIGSSAIFLSFGKCVIVDSDKLPSIDGNCIYNSLRGCNPEVIYGRYDLGKKEYTTDPQPPGAESAEGPLSLAQVLLTPDPKMKARIDRIHWLRQHYAR